MKSRLLFSLLATGLAVGAMPAIAKDIDMKKASRQEKWLWAFDSVSTGKKLSAGDKVKAYKIIDEEESGLDKANNTQAAISSAQIVDFYRRAGDIKTARAKEIKALGKIEFAAANTSNTPELSRLAQAAYKMAGYHLDKGLALSREDFESAENLLQSALNIGNKLPAKELQRSLGYRWLIKFYLENDKPDKASTYTKELSNLMHGEAGVPMPVVEEPRKPQKYYCISCGKG